MIENFFKLILRIAIIQENESSFDSVFCSNKLNTNLILRRCGKKKKKKAFECKWLECQLAHNLTLLSSLSFIETLKRISCDDLISYN